MKIIVLLIIMKIFIIKAFKRMKLLKLVIYINFLKRFFLKYYYNIFSNKTSGGIYLI